MNRNHHVGVLRIRRFIRWLTGYGYDVTVISAGARDVQHDRPWGREIVVRDPLGLHGDNQGNKPTLYRKEYSALTEYASRLVFSPDPGIAWSRRVGHAAPAIAAARKADLILSSSPPESCHLAAVTLAQGGKARLIIDMRDGWLDESLKPGLNSSSWQKWREGRLERKVLGAADQILVTSEVWRNMLLDRYPDMTEKTAVLTNCYPLEAGPEERTAPNITDEIVLMYTGQFRGSKFNNQPSLLLAPLAEATKLQARPTRVVFFGQLTLQDRLDIEGLGQLLHEAGVTLDLRAPVRPEELSRELSVAHGLLLISATMASLPAKLFNYIPTRKPILAVTPQGSAVEGLKPRLPQLHTVPVLGHDPCRGIEHFLESCRFVPAKGVVPEEFSEAFCAQRFLVSL